MAQNLNIFLYKKLKEFKQWRTEKSCGRTEKSCGVPSLPLCIPDIILINCLMIISSYFVILNVFSIF